MARPKQKILLLLCSCAVTCLILFFLYPRSWQQEDLQQSAPGTLHKPASYKYLNSQASVIKELNKKPMNIGENSMRHTESGANVAVTKPVPLQTKAPETLKTNCKIYNELRNVDFQQPALQHALCSGVKAYENTADGFPMCRLKNPFDKRILGVVRAGSATTDLLDMNNSKVKMFVYPEKDYISERIKLKHQWEPELVHTTLKFALKVPKATFLDAGCNIGVYSLLAARLGLPVVSLDANIRNLLRLRLSLSAAALDAALVWNFVGSGDQLSYLNFPGDCNVGGATKFGRAVTDSIPVMPVRSERLCSLISTTNVVIKLDVEGGEADFLRTSGCLFTKFKVAVVQMEFLRRHMVGNDSTTILEFFVSRNYSAWRTPGLSPLDTKNAATWGDGDVVFVHQEFHGLLSHVNTEKI